MAPRHFIGMWHDCLNSSIPQFKAANRSNYLRSFPINLFTPFFFLFFPFFFFSFFSFSLFIVFFYCQFSSNDPTQQNLPKIIGILVPFFTCSWFTNSKVNRFGESGCSLRNNWLFGQLLYHHLYALSWLPTRFLRKSGSIRILFTSSIESCSRGELELSASTFQAPRFHPCGHGDIKQLVSNLSPRLTAYKQPTMDGSILNTSKIPQPPHPFYPIEANIVGYLANEWSVLKLLGIFGAGCVGILGTTLALVKRQNPNLPPREKAAILWFILCKSGSIGRMKARVLTPSWLQLGRFIFSLKVRPSLESDFLEC